MSYEYTHLKHKTITDTRISMHSYNELIQLLMLIQTYAYSDLPSELQSLLHVRTTGLILVLLILYLLRSYTHGRLILIPISRMTHIYSDSLYTLLNLYIYLDGGTYHVLILLSIIYWFGAPVGVIEVTLI